VHTGNTEKYLIDLELLTSLVELTQLNLPTLNPKWHKQQHRFGTPHFPCGAHELNLSTLTSKWHKKHRFGTPHFPCGAHALNLPSLNPKWHKKYIDLELLTSLVRLMH
jgi:hypothetical protein